MSLLNHWLRQRARWLVPAAPGLCSAPATAPGSIRRISRRIPLSEREPQDQTRGVGRTGRGWLLLLGAAIGLGLAAFGLLEDRAQRQALPNHAAARVADQVIRRIDYERVLAGVIADRRNPINDEIRRRVLSRMIDEELLVQRALELGLASFDRRIRGELTSWLIESIVGEADADEPSKLEVTSHFEDHLDFFSRNGRLRAQTIFFSNRRDVEKSDGSALKRANEATNRLRRGEDWKQVEERLGDFQISRLPDGLLPTAKIRDYVGPTVLDTLETLSLETWSDPVETNGGFVLARVLHREARVVPDFAEVEEQVRQDLKRRRGNDALRRYLIELRSQKSVTIDEALFEGAN